MINTIYSHTPKSKKTSICNKEDLYNIAKKYNINTFNDKLFEVYTDKLIDIIHTKEKLNNYNIKVNWIKKTIKTNWDNKQNTNKLYTF